jgi:hypothetical protein
VIPALPALRAGVVALLEARGEMELAALVEGAGVEVSGEGERWSMGSREVVASRFMLVVAAPAFVALKGDAAKLAAVREAFASAVRTPETELAELTPVLRLPAVERGWHHVYRSAAPAAAPERAEPEAVLGGAAALLEAAGDARGAEMLRRAQLESAPVAGGGQRSLVRCVVRLDPADRVAIDRDVERGERLRRAVRDAGTRAAEAVASVELATALRPRAAEETAEARLARALEARGAVVVPVGRREGRVELAVVMGEELWRVEVAAEGESDVRWRGEQIPAVAVAEERLATAEQACAVAALLCAGGAQDG